MKPAPPNVCEHCDAELRHRTVSLELGGKVHAFCSDSCERRWMIEQHERLRVFLNRIYISTNGRAAKIAKAALFTSEQP